MWERERDEGSRLVRERLESFCVTPSSDRGLRQFDQGLYSISSPERIGKRRYWSCFCTGKKGECMDGLDVIVAGFPLLLFG